MKNLRSKLIIVLGFIVLNVGVGSAQNYSIDDGGTVNTCSGTFTDAGGNGNYGSGEDFTMTFCSSSGGEISLDFSNGGFQVETNYDFLNIYDGTNTGGTPMYQSVTTGGTVNPGVITAPSGCITIQFQSDGSFQYEGWSASISCPTCSDGIQNGTETGIDCGGATCPACPNCFNGIQDGNETGIDCGPSCPDPCHCSDGVLNGDETGIDCGGSCNPCPTECDIQLSYASTSTYDPPVVPGPDYTMSNGTVYTCGGTFYDPGGTGNYSSNELNTQTFCSDMGGQIQFDFTQWDLEGCCDYLTIYDGSTAGGTQLYYGDGADPSPGTVVSTTGCLTFYWDSDGSVTNAGWEATISCVDVPEPLGCNGGDIVLTAEGQGAFTYVLDNDFDFGNAGTGWNTNVAADYTNPCDPSLDGGVYMWMGNSAAHPREIETIPMDVSCGGEICFLLDFATQGNNSPCEGIDEADEGVFLEYSIDGGNNWVTLEYYGPAGVGNNTTGGGTDAQMTAWNQYCLTIPAGAETANTIFHWAQTGSSGLNNDHWGIDNVSISSLVDCTPYVYNYAHVGGTDNNAIQNENITATTTYDVTYSNGSDACSTSITIVVPPGTTADAGTDQIMCQGGASVVIGANAVTPDDGADYLWSTGETGTIVLTGGSQDNGQISVSPSVSTDYYLEVTFNGCTAYDTVRVEVDLPPTASNPAGINVQCIADVPAPDPNVVIDEADDITVNLAVTWVDDVSDNGSCPELITRTYRVTDECANFIDVEQIITVHDTQEPTGSAPADAAYECLSNVPVQTILEITDEADNCSASPVVAILAETQTGTCPIIITREWSITDDCSNSIVVSQTITVQDVINPTATDPDTISVAAGSVPAPDPAVVIDESDNCTVNPTVTWISDATDNGTCPEIITRIYEVEDECGNSIQVNQLILVGDAIFPTATLAGPINVECSADVPAPDPLLILDESDNGGTPTVIWEDDVTDGMSCPETITRRYRVTDDCGNFIFVSHDIIVLDVTDPVFNPQPSDVTVQCSSDIPAATSLTWNDNCDGTGDVISNDVSDGLSCPETITRTWTYTDACGNVASVSQEITVHDTQAPVFNPQPADISVECSADIPVIGTLLWNDNCDGSGSVLATDISDGLTCPETITRTWTYTDLCGNVATVSQVITVHDVTNPTATDPLTTTVPGGPAPAVDVNVVIDEEDNCTVSPIVAFVSESTDGVGCPETITRIYSVTDDCGNTTNVTHTILITDAELPTASDPLPIDVECIADVPAPDINVVTDEADNQGLPVVAYVGDVSDNGSCPEIITRTYSVTDSCGGQILVNQIITVHDITAPTASNLAPINVECIEDVPGSNVADVFDESDNCTAVPTVTFVNDVSDGASCPETIVRTYSITDDCGNESFVTQSIIVNDVTPPSADALNPINVECIDDVPSENILDVMNVSDNCALIPTVTFVNDVSDNGSCPEVITRTYSITDDCGNETTLTQIITVNDVTKPTGSNLPPLSVPGASDVPVPNISDVSDEADNCTLNPTVTFISDISNGNVCNGEIITRTYSITDDCGNMTLVTQQITIEAITPIITVEDETICEGESVTLTANNPSNDVISWDGGIQDGIAFSPTQTSVYTVTAEDHGCFNTASATVTVESVPEVLFSATDPGCEPYTVTLTNLSNSASPLIDCQWDIEGASSTINGCQEIVYTFPGAGVYDVTLTTTSQTGCSNTVTYNDYINVNEMPVASFTASSTTVSTQNTEIDFVNTSSGAITYEWLFGDGSPNSYSENTTHEFPNEESGDYVITLIATSEFGCTDTATLAIGVDEELIFYIPNTFTPDGDEYNNVFFPVFTSGYDPFDYKLLIFNRWGETVFESNDAQTGWDGTYNGKLAQDGIYTWKIEFQQIINDKRIMVTGHVNLIR